MKNEVESSSFFLFDQKRKNSIYKHHNQKINKNKRKLTRLFLEFDWKLPISASTTLNSWKSLTIAMKIIWENKLYKKWRKEEISVLLFLLLFSFFTVLWEKNKRKCNKVIIKICVRAESNFLSRSIQLWWNQKEEKNLCSRTLSIFYGKENTFLFNFIW